MKDKAKTKAQLIDELNALRARLPEAITAEEALRIVEKKYRDLFESMPDGFSHCQMVLDEKGQPEDFIYLSVNDAFEKLTGLRKKDVLGRRVTEVMPGIKETHPELFEICGKVALTGEKMEFTAYFQHLEIWLSISVYCPEKGYFVAVFSNVTESKKAEAELRETEQRFRMVLDRSLITVFYQDTNLRYTWVHSPHSGIFPGDVLGKTDEEFMSPEDAEALTAIKSRVLETGAGEHNTVQLTVGDEPSYYDLAIEPRIDAAGRIVDIMGVLIDITDRKLAERREKELQRNLTRAEKMESLGMLAGGVAHDLNNVLLPTIMLPDVIKQYLDGPAEKLDEQRGQILEYVRAIKDAGKRAVSVVRDLVTMGRRGMYETVPLDVNRVIHDNMSSDECDLLRESRPAVSLTHELANGELVISASGPHMTRIILNIIKNAVEAIGNKGEVIVRTTKQYLDQPLNGYERIPAGDYVLIEVSDTGKGIRVEDMDQIFEPFFTGKGPGNKNGSGLGLSVVHGLVKDHDGYIDLESSVGKGTTFKLYFPALEETPEQKPDDVEDSPLRGTERILIVDDEGFVLVATSTVLQQLGYTVTTADSGRDALALFEAAKKAGKEQPFDLVITDMIMEDMDGLDTCKGILDIYPDQKIIVASGYASIEKESAAKAIGADWLAKPYEAKRLATAVRERLDRD